MGIGRGADVIIYTSLAILFYLTYRLYAMFEDLHTEISKIVREIALQNPHKNKKKK